MALLLRSLLYPADVSTGSDGLANGAADISTTNEEWSRQKTANVIFVFQVLRSLVAHDNQGNSTQAAQKMMNQCGVVRDLCRILLSELGVSVDVLTEAIITVAEVIRGYNKNQEYFASTSLLAPDQPPRYDDMTEWEIICF